MSLRVLAFAILAVPQLAWPQEAPPAPAPPRILVWERRPLKAPLECRADGFEAAGIICSEEEPCRLFLELTAVDAAGPRILVGGNVHTTSATVSSLVLMSEDAGSTWHEPVRRFPAAGIEGIQFLNERQAWMAVQPHAQLATDPYLLATTDAGANWQPQPIWSEEGRAGLLQLFYFQNKDHGFVLIDRSGAVSGSGRYEFYETLTGGSTWILRESSARPIQPKGPPRRPPDWRLREDSKLKTYELERRVGDAWQRMANFATDVGVCKDLGSRPVIPNP